ncbi:MAG: hypothetical protein ACOCV2_00745 [Persicimonas sp.]
MTQRQEQQKAWTTRFRKAGFLLAAIGLLGGLVTTSLGCDTVARISFSERNFDSLHSTSISALGDSASTCEGVNSDGEMRARFVLEDTDQQPIREGDEVAEEVVGDGSFGDSISFRDAAFSETGRGTGQCESTEDDCQTDNFTCDTAPAEDLKTCHRDEGDMSIDENPIFISENDGHNVFGLLAEDTGGFRGFSVDGEGERYEELATDIDGERKSAITNMEGPFRRTAELAAENDRQSYFGLWSFGGANVESTYSDGNFVTKPANISQATGNYDDSQSNRQLPASVYESLATTIEDYLSAEALEGDDDLNMSSTSAADASKTLALLVDGPDELGEADDDDVDNVIDLAQEHGVRVFIYHFDPELEAYVEGSDRQMPDPRDYWEDSSGTCSDDSDCAKSYETCRKPIDAKGQVMEDEDEYCLVERDEESGRIGPIDDYAQLACATGGSYEYLASPGALETRMNWLPYAMEGLWETTLTSARVDRGQLDAGSSYFVHGRMELALHGDESGYSFRLGDEPEEDARSVVFIGD